MPDATTASMIRRYSRVAASASARLRDAFAEVVERLQEAARFDRAGRRRSPRSIVSPAMNRRAKLVGFRMP